MGYFELSSFPNKGQFITKSRDMVYHLIAKFLSIYEKKCVGFTETLKNVLELQAKVPNVFISPKIFWSHSDDFQHALARDFILDG